MDEVQLLTRKDCLRALYNSFMQKLIQAEANVDFYKYKKENLRNGEDKKTIEISLVTSERNVMDNTTMLAVFDKKLKELDAEKANDN